MIFRILINSKGPLLFVLHEKIAAAGVADMARGITDVAAGIACRRALRFDLLLQMEVALLRVSEASRQDPCMMRPRRVSICTTPEVDSAAETRRRRRRRSHSDASRVSPVIQSRI